MTDSEPTSADSLAKLRQRAERWLEFNAIPRAVAIYREILDEYPEDVETLRALAHLVNEANSADRYFRRLRSLTTLTVGDYLLWAERMSASERFSQAAGLVEDAHEVATTPEEKLKVAEAIAGLPGNDSLEMVLDLVDPQLEGEAGRITALLTNVLRRAPADVDLVPLARLLEGAAPSAGEELAVNAVDALMARGLGRQAQAIWNALARPDTPRGDHKDIRRLFSYLWVGGQIALDSGQPHQSAELYGEALELWNSDTDSRELSRDEAVERRSDIAPLESDYLSALLDTGRFAQVLDESDKWERADNAALALPAPTAEKGEFQEPQAPASTATLEPAGAIVRQLARAVAHLGLGHNKEGLTALFEFDQMLAAQDDVEAYAGLRAAAIYFRCWIETDSEKALERIARTFSASTDHLERNVILQRVESYRLWTERDASVAPASGDVVREELARHTRATRDPSVHAILALYAGQLYLARSALDRRGGADWRDEKTRAVVALELRTADAAARHCDEVLAQRPFDIDAELLRAEIERQRNNPGAARMMAEDIAQRRPDSVEAHLLVADCCYELARGFDDADRSRVDVALLREATERYRVAVLLSDNLRSFLEELGGGKAEQKVASGGQTGPQKLDGRVGSSWLSAKNYQQAVQRGATCAVRAAVLLEKRHLPADRALDKKRKELINAIDDAPVRRRLQRAVLLNRLARGRRWLGNFALVIGIAGVCLVVASILFQSFFVHWLPNDTLALLIAFVVLALFPTISEFSLPGGIGLKRQMAPARDESDFQSSELLRTPPSISARVLSPSPPPLQNASTPDESISPAAKGARDVSRAGA